MSEIETEAERDIRRLKRLVQYCRMRLKREVYATYVDKCLADLSILDPDPEMQGKLVQSAPPVEAKSEVVG